MIVKFHVKLFLLILVKFQYKQGRNKVQEVAQSHEFFNLGWSLRLFQAAFELDYRKRLRREEEKAQQIFYIRLNMYIIL